MSNSHLLGQVEDILTWFSLAEAPGTTLALSHFDGAEPMTEGFLEAADGFADIKTALGFLRETVTPFDLSGPVDFSWVAGISWLKWDERGEREREEKTTKFRYSFQRVRTDTGGQRIFRGVRQCPRMARYDVAAARTDDARVVSNTMYCGWQRGEWAPVTLGQHPLYHDRMSVEACGTAHRMAFIRRYNWSVLLGYAGSPRLRFQTDACGAREVFRLRDLPEGKARRSALLHWVEEHWRKRRVDDEPHKVRRHLRGAEQFVWNGLRCAVEPSAFDLESAQKATAE